jgi:hypothetical protein
MLVVIVLQPLRVAVVLTFAVGIGCAPASHPPSTLDGGPLDGGASLLDAGDGAAGDATECTASPMADGCPCAAEYEGVTHCIGYTVQCCGGRWRYYHDGPCRRLDGGAITPTCEHPEPGCPCSTDGESMCRNFQWDIVCVDGTWAESVGHACCIPGFRATAERGGWPDRSRRS